MDKNIKRGKCVNYGECDQASQIHEIEEGQPFECPYCHNPLQEVDAKGKPVKGSVKSGRKKGGLKPLPIIVGIIFIGLVIAAIIIFVPRSNNNIAEEGNLDSNVFDTGIKEEVLTSSDSLIEAPPQEVKSDAITETNTQSPTPTSTSIPSPSSKEVIGSQHKLSYGSWTGGWKNGKPNGTGTMTYSESHRIDLRDSKERIAQPGEYIVGEWDNGNLVQGRWFKNDGSKEAIIIGKAG